MLTPDYLRSKFDAGRDYAGYLQTGTDAQRIDWTKVYEQVSLTDAQRGLVASFTRRVNLLVVSGIWCGDCVQQVPMLARLAEANPETVALRIVDRDEHKDLAERVTLCGGLRVPTVLFLGEEFTLCGLYGDRTLSRYRALARRQLGEGAACELTIAPAAGSEQAQTLQDWCDELERVHLMLRISPRLRQKHGD